MFFSGSLHDAISTALQQSKSVVCFVTDGQEQSQRWETDFFPIESVKKLLDGRAVTLRLAAGTQEEGFLTALFPIPKKPSVVIIKDGQLKEYISSGVSREDFIKRVTKALESTNPTAASVSSSTGSAADHSAAINTTPTNTQTFPQGSTPAPPPERAAQPLAPAPASANSNPANTNARVQAILAERAACLTAQRQSEAEEAKRTQAAKKAAEAQAAQADPTSEAAQRSRHASELRKRQQEARLERQRILKDIEDDKAARKARQVERKAAQRTLIANSDVKLSKEGDLDAICKDGVCERRPASSVSNHCAIQVRLLDGSTIRKRFPGSETVRGAVRPWVDSAAAAMPASKRPYTFKLLLTPWPSQAIDSTREDKTLVSLGLAPSATLVMVPAWSQGGSGVAEENGNFFQRFFAYILAIFVGLLGGVGVFVSTLFNTAGALGQDSGAGARAAVGSDSTSGASTDVASSELRRRGEGATIRGGQVKGFQKKEKVDDQQFYNGNSTNFEPRKDEDEEQPV